MNLLTKCKLIVKEKQIMGRYPQEVWSVSAVVKLASGGSTPSRLGIWSLTRNLHSTPFQYPGGDAPDIQTI